MPRLSFHCTEKKQHSSFHSFEISSFCVCMQSTSRGQRGARAYIHLSVALASPEAIGGAFAHTTPITVTYLRRVFAHETRVLTPLPNTMLVMYQCSPECQNIQKHDSQEALF